MKKSLLLGCLLLWGCDMGLSHKTKVIAEVTDATGSHRLVLRYIEVKLPMKNRKDGKAYDFHSLTWEAKDGKKWSDKVVISRDDFQKGFARRRWVSNVQSLDARTGCAVIQVGEEGPPDATGALKVTYSWREWDVANNKELRVIRVCKDPFEPFEKPKPDS